MQLTKSLVVIVALIGVITESAVASVEPYFGGSCEWSTANHRRGSSQGSMFNKYFGGASAYAGARWKDISFEAGHESTGQKDKTGSHVTPSKDVEVVTAGIRTKNYFTGWHLDLNTHFPIWDDFELLGSLGYGAIKHRAAAQIDLSSSNKVVFTERLHFSNRYKNTLRFGIGAQQMICNHVGIRFMARYKLINNRARLKSDLFGINEIVKYKNIVSLSAGFFVKF